MFFGSKQTICKHKWTDSMSRHCEIDEICFAFSDHMQQQLKYYHYAKPAMPSQHRLIDLLQIKCAASEPCVFVAPNQMCCVKTICFICSKPNVLCQKHLFYLLQVKYAVSKPFSFAPSQMCCVKTMCLCCSKSNMLRQNHLCLLLHLNDALQK